MEPAAEEYKDFDISLMQKDITQYFASAADLV
jgi:hypothetical protein